MAQLTPQKRFRPPKGAAAQPKRPLAKGFSQMQKMMGRGTGLARKAASPKMKLK